MLCQQVIIASRGGGLKRIVVEKGGEVGCWIIRRRTKRGGLAVAEVCGVDLVAFHEIVDSFSGEASELGDFIDIPGGDFEQASDIGAFKVRLGFVIRERLVILAKLSWEVEIGDLDPLLVRCEE